MKINTCQSVKTVLTTTGVRLINEVYPGDHVIEYKTGKALPVLGIYAETNDGTVDGYIDQRCIEVRYSDGRRMFVNINGYVYDGKDIFPVRKFKNHLENHPLIHQYQVEYSAKRKPIKIDPYVAGAFIMNGDFTDPYMNLPAPSSKVREMLRIKYWLTYELERSECDGKTYFYYDQGLTKYPRGRVRWDEFFPTYHFWRQRPPFEYIPTEYLYGSIETRKQFIRGAFDTYMDSVKHTTKMISISNSSEFILRFFRQMLWSVGLLSTIDIRDYGKKYDEYAIFNEDVIRHSSDRYILTLLANTTSENVGLFYDPNLVNYEILYNDCGTYNNLAYPHLAGCRIVAYREDPSIYNESAKNIMIGDRKHAIYMNGDFLPVVSI